MSNTRKCREAHGGGFTRPKRLWTGRHRAKSQVAYGAKLKQTVVETAKLMTRQAAGTRVTFNRKDGG